MPHLNLNDVDIHYETFGTGQPLVLISGTAIHGDIWKPYQVPEFARDHQVIVYDQRGTGKTVMRSQDFSTKAMADDIAALLDHVAPGRKAVVLGHSMGGRVAQLVALDHPGKVDQLVLASTGAAFKARGISVDLCIALVEKGLDRYVRDNCMHSGFTKAVYEAHRDEIEKWLAIRLGNPPTLENFLHHIVSRQEHDTSGRLKDIRVPTLVIAGSEEVEAGVSGLTHLESSQMLAREIPGATFVLIPGHKHYYFYADPKASNAVVREFLAGH